MRGLIEHWQNNDGTIGNDTVGESRAWSPSTPRARGIKTRSASFAEGPYGLDMASLVVFWQFANSIL